MRGTACDTRIIRVSQAVCNVWDNVDGEKRFVKVVQAVRGPRR
jgi:predicted DCC family thiol-disulfide oxidoreductase YuxK